MQPPRIKTEFDDAVYGNSNGNDNGGYYYPNATGHDGSTAGMVSPVPTLSPSSPLAMSYALDQRTKKSNKKVHKHFPLQRRILALIII